MKSLDTSSIPILYNIFFKIDINNNIYNGFNNILLNIIKNTNQIQFHSSNIEIKKIILQDKKILSEEYDDINDIFTITFDSIINVGIHEFIIYFEGKMTSDTGLIKYIHADTNRTFIYTRFEPIYARQCYPCWDEPIYKVKYNISIQINDPSYIVLTNTDPYNIQHISNTEILYNFYESIPMSSYVSSFIICKFKYIEAISKHNIRLRVYIPTDINDNSCGNFALDCGIKMLDYLIDYLNLSFPYNKIDFIPINDTSVQGMENFGLIFYNLDYLLLYKEVTTLDQQIQIAHVIAHELAHQWFGNLLSINEWDNLWLKESFARFFQYLIVENIFPKWNTISLNINNIIKTLDYDSYCYKSIKQTIYNKDNIHDIYNKLTYDKGGILLNILLNYIGFDNFKINIQNYINKYKHTIIDNNKFIDAICENLSNDLQENVKLLINHYIHINGYPIIKFNNSQINFESFNYIESIKNKINTKKSNTELENINWQIIINMFDNNLILYNNNKIEHDSVINNKLYCYYRICYNDKEFNNILNNIYNQTSQQQLSILNDLYILGIYLKCPLDYWFKYVNKLIKLLFKYDDINKFDYYLLNMIYNSITHVYKLTKNKQVEEYLLNPMNKLINKLYILIDINNLSLYQTINLTSDNINYNLLLYLLLNLEVDTSTDILNKMFDNNLFNICADINYAIIKRIIKNNDISRFNKFNQVKNDYPFMHKIIKECLSYSSNKTIINEIFNNIISNTTIIDYIYINDLLSNNEYFLLIFTKNFLNNFDLNYKIYSQNSIKFNKLINNILINQTDYNIILQLLTKFKQYNQINIVEIKYNLFNKLFQKFNIIKLIKNMS